MTAPNRRRAARVCVGFPVQIYGNCGFVMGEVRDLSRTGLRMRVPTDDLGFSPTSNLREAAEGVAEALRDRFALDLHFEHLGPLLQRNVTLARIGLPAEAPGCVEICCQFDRELSDTDASFLETDLPPLQEVVAAWVPSEHLPETCSGVVTLDPCAEPPVKIPRAEHDRPTPCERPRQRYRALVRGTRRDAPSSFFCHTDLVTAIGVRVRIPRADYGDHVTPAMRRVVARYGREMELRIVGKEGEDLWTGAVQVNGVELPGEQRDVMLVTLGFLEPLRLSELRQLGLVQRAA